MKAAGSITRRLIVTLGLCAIAFWLAAVGIATNVIRHELNDAFNQTLRQSALRLLPLALHELEEMIFEGEFEDEQARLIASLSDQGSNLDYFITDPSGRILVFASDTPPQRSTILVEPGFSTVNDAPAFGLRDPRTGIGIVVVERPGLRAEFLRESLMAMLLPLAALIPVLVVLVFLIMRTAMKPVLTLGTVIAQRHGRNLSPLNIGPQPAELAPIVDEVENLLARLKSALEAERNFAAESAHELRTPIAGALAQVQVLRNMLDGTPNKQFALQAEEALRNLSHLSENLLQTARLEAGFALSSKLENLGAVIEPVLADREFAPHRDRIRITGQPGDLQAFVMPDAFAIVLRNLINNAVLYAEGDDAITLTIGPKQLTITNDCTPLDAELLQQLTTRFVRGDKTKRGSGLGLSIVARIVQDCNGTLTLSSPIHETSRGFSATLIFP